MSKKEKKQNEKNDNENELEEAMAQLTLNNQQLQGTAQQLANQLNQYIALCGHYEQTINVMSGRIQEMKQQISNLAQQQNSD
tara:strand:+ start:1760 stop:2005 length:246 start_codon:yes stop_codon:yes gene_type:complete